MKILRTLLTACVLGTGLAACAESPREVLVPESPRLQGAPGPGAGPGPGPSSDSTLIGQGGFTIGSGN